MGFDFKHSVDIDRPAGDVFAFVANFEHNPRWQGGMETCQWTSERTGTVGSTYAQQARFMGKTIETKFVVTAVTAGREISIESTESTFPIQVTRTVEPVGDASCRVTAHVRGQPKGLLRLFAPLVKRSIRNDYRKLKQLLEDRPPA